MFNFSTTRILNAAPAGTDPKVIGIGDKKNIVSVTKVTGAEGTPAKATITIPLEQGRLVVHVGVTQELATSIYSNDGAYKFKPVTIDFAAGTKATALADMITKLQANVYGEKIFTVSGSEQTLTLTAANAYQTFEKVVTEKFDKDASVMGDYVLSAEGDVTPGKEPKGTYTYLLHNVHIPTCANTDPFGVGASEAPVVNGIYDEYIVEYCAERGPLGMNAVGQNVTSVTYHHIFALQGDTSNWVATNVKAAGTGE